MLSRLIPLVLVSVLACYGQTLKQCRSVYIEPMAESLDRFVSAELVKWGEMKVVTLETKADCVLRFPRPSSRTQVESSGSLIVPQKARVESQSASEELPSARPGLRGADGKMAALELVHRESSSVVWAESRANVFTSGGAKELARKLVKQLRKDFEKPAAKRR